eukprot:TRINITY_DN33391_c0_g1_i1.p1 TRINITY_DN33391_c0_g1~~TRINITY_DN33391_c0_g1_i1.p1  ORF type:complete len:607 (+),score=158.15 TRINITY_DN33391_c0_g1_i1:80-1900(+)
MEVPKAIKKEVAACKKKGKPCNLTNFKQFPREVYNEVIAELSGFSEINLASNGIIKVYDDFSPIATSLRALDLSDNSLSALPDSFANLTNLTELNLSNNSFTSIPDAVFNLPSLQVLKFSNNPLVSLNPPENSFPSIKQVDLSSTKMTSFPNCLLVYPNLEAITLSGAGVTSIPPEISKLKSLKGLIVNRCNLSELPVSLAELPELQILEANNNRIKDTEKLEMHRMANLRKLDLSTNAMDVPPSSMGEAPNLTSLLLHDNRIEEIPLGSYKTIETLTLDNNLLTALPTELGEAANLKNFTANGNTFPSFLAKPATKGGSKLIKYLAGDYAKDLEKYAKKMEKKELRARSKTMKAVKKSDKAMMGGSVRMAQSPVAQEKEANFRAKLSEFIHDRPTKEELTKLGIIQEPLFGGNLEIVLALSDRSDDVPLPIECLIKTLRERKAEEVTGIFRVSGSAAEIQSLRLDFNRGATPDMSKTDIHVVSGLLKLYFRELSEPLLTFARYKEFIAANRISDQAERLEAVKKTLASLPLANRRLLVYLMSYLVQVAALASSNKMTPQNVGVVFGPTLLRPEIETMETMMDTTHQTRIVESFCIEHDSIFGNLI